VIIAISEGSLSLTTLEEYSYYNNSDLSTYLQYIILMQQEGLPDEYFESVELQDLQGVYGLKAIRVTVSGMS
jgi:hypothetical protein